MLPLTFFDSLTKHFSCKMSPTSFYNIAGLHGICTLMGPLGRALGFTFVTFFRSLSAVDEIHFMHYSECHPFSSNWVFMIHEAVKYAHTHTQMFSYMENWSNSWIILILLTLLLLLNQFMFVFVCNLFCFIKLSWLKRKLLGLTIILLLQVLGSSHLFAE